MSHLNLKSIDHLFLLRWFTRIAAVYLFFWWELLFLAFSEGVSGVSPGFWVYIRSGAFFLLFSLCLWIATLELGKRLRWILILPIVAVLGFNLTVIMGKHYYVNVLGAAAAIVAIYFLFMKRSIVEV
jgi:hypothetical protein